MRALFFRCSLWRILQLRPLTHICLLFPNHKRVRHTHTHTHTPRERERERDAKQTQAHTHTPHTHAHSHTPHTSALTHTHTRTHTHTLTHTHTHTHLTERTSQIQTHFCLRDYDSDDKPSGDPRPLLQANINTAHFCRDALLIMHYD